MSKEALQKNQSSKKSKSTERRICSVLKHPNVELE